MYARLLLLPLVTSLTVWLARAQPCRITDAGGRGIPYANVYVPDLGTGVVSGPEGAVRLSPKLAEAAPATPVTVSCIGFDDREAVLGDLQANEADCGLELTEASYPLARVEIRAPRFTGTLRQLGFRKDLTRAVGHFYTADDAGDSIVSGAELGNLMEARGEWRLRTVGVNVEVDAPTRFEINVYALADGRPAGRLHRDRIFFDLPACTDEVHVDSLDVSHLGITGHGRFLLAVEVLGPSPEITAVDLGDSARTASHFPRFNFRIALRRKDRLTRYRDRSGRWRKTPLGTVAGIWCVVER